MLDKNVISLSENLFLEHYGQSFQHHKLVVVFFKEQISRI